MADDSSLTTLDRGARSVTYHFESSGARLIDVAYPGGTEYETHTHHEAYLCLAWRGSYREWFREGGGRAVSAGQSLVYRPGSAHAVAIGDEPVRMLHVTDPSEVGWRSAGPLAPGLLWQIAVDRERAGGNPADGDDRLHLECLLSELSECACDRVERGRAGGEGPERQGWLYQVRDRLRSEAGV